MIGFDVKIERERSRALERRSEKGVFRTLGHAAAAIRSTARRLIGRQKTPGAEGEPIHSPTGQAKQADAVLYDVDREADDAVVGFTKSAMGEAMAAHEHGKTYLGDEFPARPTMEPALEVNLVRFADEFEGSIGQ